MALNKESPSIPVPPPLPNLNKDAYLKKEILEATLIVWPFSKDPLKELTECCNQYLDHSPEIISYKYISPILQEGPKCGLVALSMASSCTENFVNVEQVFNEATRRMFTNQGEMFSVHNMAILAKEFVSLNVEEITTSSEKNRNYLLDQLSSGSLLLIPYDADANHSPCLKQGHKAHWALVCGFVRTKENRILVTARQGKSRRLALWDWNHLLASNDNLFELDPIRATDGYNYVLPSGGIEGGLKSQALLIKLLHS